MMATTLWRRSYYDDERYLRVGHIAEARMCHHEGPDLSTEATSRSRLPSYSRSPSRFGILINQGCRGQESRSPIRSVTTDQNITSEGLAASRRFQQTHQLDLWEILFFWIKGYR